MQEIGLARTMVYFQNARLQKKYTAQRRSNGNDMKMLDLQRMTTCYATKFHPDVLCPQCKQNVKWVLL